MTFRKLTIPFLAGIMLFAWSGRQPEQASAGNAGSKLDGKWILWRSVKGGDTTADSGEGIIVDGTSMQFLLRGKNLAEKGTLTIKEDAEPKEIDLEHTFGRYKGKKQLGIYRITPTGNLEISWGEPGAEKRPTKFSGKPEPGAGSPLTIYRPDNYKIPEEVAKELKSFEGKWKVVQYHRFGRPEVNATKRGEGFILDGEDVQYFWGGTNKGGKAQFFVDPSTSPKQIEFVYTVGQDRYKKRIGIYKMVGNKLEISLSAINSDTRPTAFTGIKGTPGAGDAYFAYEKE